MSSVIEFTDVTHRFGTHAALRDLHLAVPAGSIFGFLGHNGAGKTTSIRLLLGLAHLQQGSVQVLGRDIRRARVDILRRVGAMVEEPALYPHLTGREHLQLVRTLHGNTGSHAQPIAANRVDHVLHLVDLTDAANRRVKGYSQGMRQRLGLAIALLHDPELLVLDEPTNGLDPAGMRALRELFTLLSREYGKTVFVSSHLLAEVEKMATHVGIIHQGSIVYQGTVAGLAAQRGQVRLALHVGNGTQAGQALTAAGFSYAAAQHPEDDQHQLSVPLAAREEAAQVIRALVEHGVEVYAARPQESLEDVFFGLTQTQVHA